MEALFSDYEDVRNSGLFDAEYYLATYPDVARRNVDPLVHYLEEGARQGRNPHRSFDSAFYFEQCRERGEQPDNPLLHYIRIGAARGFATRRDRAAGTRRIRQHGTAEEPAKPPILVAIEALGAVGTPGGNSRLSVSGWALAAAPIAEITVSMHGRIVGTATYGLPRPDIARLYPDRPGAADCGFILAFDLAGLSGSTVEPMLTVRTTDGEVGHRALSVEIPPQEVEVGVVDPTAPARMAKPEAAKPPMQLQIDDAAVDPSGVLHIEGWVVCLVQIESVEVFLDGVAIGKAEFGRARGDIEKLHPDYPNARFAGFRLFTDVSALGSGLRILTVTATARTGISGKAAAQVEIPAHRPSGLAAAAATADFRYHCDEVTLTPAGRLALRGWAVCPAPTRAIVVLLDGEDLGHAEIGLERPDVGNLYPGLPHARRPGFAFDLSTGKEIDGSQVVTLRVCREDGEIDEAQLQVTAGAGNISYAGYADGEPDHRLHLDTPELIDGAVEQPVRGNLQIGGWALARSGVAAIEITVDGRPLALADYGLRRLDIRAAFPDWEDSLASGFSAVLPMRVVPEGNHTVSVALRDKTDRVSRLEFTIEVEEHPDAPGPWSLKRRMTQAEIDLNRSILQHCARPARFAVVLPVGGDNESLHRAGATLATLGAQVYPNWRLIVVPQGTGKRARLAADQLVARWPAIADRVAVVRDLTLHALAERDSGADAGAGDLFFVVLSPGDELGVDALLELAIASAQHAEADFLYSDERRRNPATGGVEAFFKPQWSPDLLISTNYIGRLWCARGELLRSVAGPADRLLGHGEYDLVLRCTEAAKAIRHIPAVLCQRADRDIEPPARMKAALKRMLARRGIAGEIGGNSIAGTYRVRRALAKPGMVSIIIPTCAAEGMIETCIASLRRLTAYRDYEIVCIENIPPADRKWLEWLSRNADRVISTQEPFNWSRFNNLAAAAARGDYLLFLNDDIEIDDPDWLGALVAEAQRPEVAVVGPRLLYPDRRVQHAGMFLAAPGQARHAFRYAAEDEAGYFGLALTQRNVIAVTGACLMTRRDTFEALGGFNETHSIVNNDLDYCLRAWQSGQLIVYTPHVTLIHHEAISRAGLDDVYDEAAFDDKWRDLFLEGDPFFSPHLAKNHDGFVVDREPTHLLVTGRPVLRREDIRKILVVKLDHIGDCILAFPAVRRLKEHFPDARLTVLTSHASRPVWSLEASVDETIAFDFFHARSALGEIERTEEDWRELRERLAPEQFDLAVDLRKHTETRPALQHTGARFLAGFDFRNQFPWLDIALEWTGDQIYARKRQHNLDDLVNLVDAIAAAGDSDRTVIAARPAEAPELAALKRRKSAGPLVCVHPTVGNDARQWPAEYFAAVIDRLIEKDRAHVVLIGGPGDEDVAAAIVARVRRPKKVSSLVGKMPLSALPGLLAGVSLFLGNNSGPKHIAAGLGVPTVGVHSGTEDVIEWGPVGPSAIAVAREVVCAPCYLANAEDCRRGMACLRDLEPARVYDACKRLLLLDAAPQPAPRPDKTRPLVARRTMG